MLNDKGEEVGIIYGWFNTLTDMWYIGQTINPEGRFNCHIRLSLNNDNTHFHRALRKYGLDNWVYCVLEDNILRENLNLKEQEWIEYYDSFYCGYNLTTGGDTNCIFSEEVKEKLKGQKRSEETRKRISDACKGKHLSDETKEKLSKANKGQIPWNKGKCLSNEHKKKLSESCKGNIPTNRRKVSKYDLNGNFIKKYDCITDALKENPKCGKNIIAVCQGKRRQAGGFIWKYA